MTIQDLKTLILECEQQIIDCTKEKVRLQHELRKAERAEKKQRAATKGALKCHTNRKSK